MRSPVTVCEGRTTTTKNPTEDRIPRKSTSEQEAQRKEPTKKLRRKGARSEEAKEP